ncbi:MAG: organomercurial lyase [Chloroflexota bacterium]
MNKPLLPAIDTAGQLRETAFAFLLRDQRPVSPNELADATALGRDAVTASVGALATAGWLDLNAEGRVTGSSGLSLDTGPHRLTLSGAAFRTWCAYDALGIAAALHADAVVETTCGECAAPMALGFDAEIPERAGAERLWLAEGDDDLRGSFCTPTVLLCGVELGRRWAERQGGRGHLLDLMEAAQAGARDWAGCALAAERLA